MKEIVNHFFKFKFFRGLIYATVLFLFITAQAETIKTHKKIDSKNPSSAILMTGQDISNNALSNVTISNNTNQPITVYGLYIASYDINDCSACFGGVVSGNNAGGTVASPITFRVGQTAPVGQNYLYNMLYNGIYFIKNTVGSSPCSLPGCSWPGDDPGVTGWCISVGVVSLDSNYTHSSYTNGSNPPANTVTYGAAVTSPPNNYNYDLVNPNSLGTGAACIGPITCNDQSLTCSVQTAQNESFQPY